MATTRGEAAGMIDGLHHQNNNSPKQLYCAMVPLVGLAGHFIPMVDTGLLLAELGVAVTVFTTQLTADRIQPILDRARASSLPFDVEILPFLANDNASSFKSLADFLALMGSLPTLTNHLRDRLAPRAAAGNMFLIVDYCHHWTISVARELRVPRYVIYNMPSFTNLSLRRLQQYYVRVAGDEAASDGSFTTTPVPIPGIPHHVQITPKQALGLFPGWDRFIYQMEENDAAADGILLISASALESDYKDLYAREVGKKVWSVGPVSLGNEGDPKRAAVRGGRSSTKDAEIFNWLDSMKCKSVVYFAFGSLVCLSRVQLEEILAGLEAAGHPFLCVAHVAPEDLEQVESWLSASGFAERNKGRGIVITSWAPQQLILSHPSVGGFVSHCGWNSFLEAITYGVPMATWPRFGDQFLTERMIVDVLGVGVSIGVHEQEWNWWFDSGAEARVVSRERVTSVIGKLMGEGEEAEERRKKAEDLKVKSRMAMKPDVGDSRTALVALLEDAARQAQLMQQQHDIADDQPSNKIPIIVSPRTHKVENVMNNTFG